MIDIRLTASARDMAGIDVEITPGYCARELVLGVREQGKTDMK
jgi:hypothetical protein